LNNPLKPFSDMTKNMAGLLQSARGLMEKASGEGFGQGLKGMVQDILDLNIDSLIENVDSKIGAGVMRLVMAGDTVGMETVVQFRNYTVMRLVELRDVRDVANKFMSEDPELEATGLGEMREFLGGKEPEVVCSEREETLRQEIVKLKKIVKQMSIFLEGESLLLGDDIERTEIIEEIKEEKETVISRIPPQANSIIIRGDRASSSS
jgi:hypothetical protein